MNKYPLMLSPYTIKNTTFKNRVFAAPTTTNQKTLNGAMAAEGLEGFEAKARGGFAQVTMNETYVDFEYAARHDESIDLIRENMTTYHQCSIGNLTRAIKDHGAIASIQLQHVGAVNNNIMCVGGSDPIGPIEFIRPDGVHIQAMDEAMIEHVADNYAFAARRAQQLGFDMVMVHAGHGWLLSQFLSPRTNKRTDRWGGSLENRAGFILLVLEKIREAAGEDFLIELRVSGDERMEGGMKIEDTAEFAKIVQPYCDLIHVTSGIYHSPVETKWCSSMFEKHGCNLDLAAAIKAAVDIPVVAVGGFNSPAQIEEALAEGKCDFVALGRQHYADPDFVNKTILGIEDEIAPCLRCSCFNPLPADPKTRVMGINWTCAVNPWFGRELRWRWAPAPKGPRKVLIIGGGAAGLYAAITAAERGHDVTLAEKSGRLGGVLWFADVDVHKEDLRRFRDSLIVRAQRRGVKLCLNTEVDKDYIEKFNADAVICCVGAEPVTPPIPGIGFAHQAMYAYEEPDKVTGKVLIIGGGLVGCELGFHLACCGRTVHIVEMQDDIAKDGKDSHRRGLIPRMKECMTWDVNCVCKEIKEGGAVIIDGTGTERFIEADTILYATGMTAKTGLVESLRAAGGWFVACGDCKEARLLENATYEGFVAAMDIIL